jgi:LuxR family transcriptional regulator, maltose regulon positive regulatory protein
VGEWRPEAPAGRAAALPVVGSKLALVAPPLWPVVRSRLLARLDDAGAAALLVAPPGYGKTALVAQWVEPQAAKGRVAWVSLDPLDRNPLTMWRHVIAGIAGVVPSASEAEEVLLERGPADGAFLATLLHSLLRETEPVVLVLDDLHLVDAPDVGDQLGLLVERSAGSLRLVGTARFDPAVPTARWRMQGIVSEIRAADLAFRPEEAAQLLGRFDLPLDDRAVARLTERTEGWAVGLLLAGLSLSEHPDRMAHLDDLLTSDRLLADYLVTELLRRLPSEEVELALGLAVLPVFDLRSCAELLGDAGRATLLRRLVRRNPFIAEVGSTPDVSYRFHPLIRQFLLAELRWTAPERFDRLHRKGAEILAAEGRLDMAVSLLLEIDAVDAAFDLVVRPVLAIGDARGFAHYRRLFEQLPPIRPEDPDRAMDYALALHFAGRLDEAEAWCEQAATMLDGRAEPAQLRQLHVIRLIVVGASGDYLRALEEVDGFVAVQGSEPRGAATDRFAGLVARGLLGIDDLASAGRWLDDLRAVQHPILAGVLAPALDAEMLLARGRPADALARAREALAAAGRLGIRPHPAVLDALLASGVAQYDLLELAAARETLEAAIEDAPAFNAWGRARAWSAMIALQAVADGWPRALDTLQTARSTFLDDVRGVLRTRLDELEARALLGCGRPDDAAALVERLPPGPRRALVAARRLLVSGRAVAVPPLLDELDDWPVPFAVEALLLRAQAGTAETAVADLERALLLAAPGGLVTPFVIAGEPVERMLGRVDVEALHPALHRRLTLAAAPVPRARRLVIEPMTPREAEILALLPTHLTYGEIGTRLYISANTVKTNIRAIYRKLGVGDRSDAVERARLGGLLP